jgi:glutaredoxin-like protein
MSFENREGQRVPEVTFRTRQNNEWKDISSKDIFAGKKVVLFSLPGAFTPTCSSSHVPRFEELAQALKAKGVDTIACVSVNDTFVMNEWAKDQNAASVLFLPDGNGEFTEKMGLLVDKANLGFGKRSWRYSMYVEDGTIKKMFIEPEKDGDPFEVSDADTMLKYLDPQGKTPSDVLMFTKPGCGFCEKARTLLDQHGLKYEEVQSSNRKLRAVSGKQTTPQVFIDGKYIGGSDDLEKYFSAGR